MAAQVRELQEGQARLKHQCNEAQYLEMQARFILVQHNMYYKLGCTGARLESEALKCLFFFEHRFTLTDPTASLIREQTIPFLGRS